MVYQDVSIERKPFVWRTLQEHNDTNDSLTCRNSVQGKLLLVDDRGKQLLLLINFLVVSYSHRSHSYEELMKSSSIN